MEEGQIWEKGEPLSRKSVFLVSCLFNQNGIFKLNNSTCFQSNDRYGQVMRIAKTSPGRFVIWFGKSLISPLQKMNVGPARKL